jgi:hypothetical protein
MTIKRITLIVFLAASCNLAWQFYRMHREDVARERAYAQGAIVCSFGPSADERSRVYVELFLLLAVVGSRSKRLTNTLLTVTGLSGAAIIYILWWQYVFRVATNAEVPVQSLSHFGYLRRGNPLDLAVAASIAALVVLNVGDAVHSLVYKTDQEMRHNFTGLTSIVTSFG